MKTAETRASGLSIRDWLFIQKHYPQMTFWDCTITEMMLCLYDWDWPCALFWLVTMLDTSKCTKIQILAHCLTTNWLFLSVCCRCNNGSPQTGQKAVTAYFKQFIMAHSQLQMQHCGCQAQACSWCHGQQPATACSCWHCPHSKAWGQLTQPWVRTVSYMEVILSIS